jgi:hypothetical protein
MPAGRPSSYTPEKAAAICGRLAAGEPLVRICRDESLPDVVTVYRWIAAYEDFRNMYARAREDQADTLADEIADIADENPRAVPVYGREGELVEIKIDTAFEAWRKTRIDARKWSAAKLKPRKYGEKLELAGDPDRPMKMEFAWVKPSE